MAYYALKKDVFDINKVTVVGSPTITSDGVASGFSSGNYIKANISSLDLTDNFKLSFQIITSSDVTTEQSVWGTTCNNQAFVYQIYNGVFRLYYPTGTGQRGIIDFGEVEANKTYNITLSCKNGTLTIQDYNKSFSFLGSTITFLYMGSGRFENTTMFKGSIDLPSFKVTTNNTTFSPTKPTYLLERRKEGYDPSKFTVVGTPTITEDGVASGFSASNYVTTKNSIDFSNANSWEIITPVFKHSPDLTVLSTVLCGSVQPTGSLDGIAIFMRPSGHTSWSVQGVQGGSFIFKRDANTTFTDGALNQFKMEFTGKAYNFYHSVNGGTFELIDTFASTTKTTVNTLLYLGAGISQYYRGDYYALPSISITVDGKEVFTGAEENYYMLSV